MIPHWYDHFLFALLGIVIPLLSVQSRIRQDEEGLELILPPKKSVYLNNFFILFIGMLLCLTAWHAGKNDWAILGFSHVEINKTAIIATGLLLLFYFSDGILTYFRQNRSREYYHQMKDIIPVNWKEYRSFLPLAFMAGLSEEIIYRGYLYHYLLSYFPDFTYASYISILIASLGFSLGHLYQGWHAIIKIFLISLLFGVIYIHTKSLLAVIIIHILIDVISGMSGIFMHKNQDEPE